MASSTTNKKVIEYYKQYVFNNPSSCYADENFTNFNFIDEKVICSSGNLNLIQDNSYFVTFAIKKKLVPQTIQFRLVGSENDLVQYIDTIYVPIRINENNNQESVIYTYIITPFQDNMILQWEAVDEEPKKIYFLGNELGADSLTKIRPLINLINSDTPIMNIPNDNETVITKIGLQGAPGLLFCLNGEQFRIGKNGIFELTNDLEINKFCIALKENSYVIVDLKYKTIFTEQGGE